MNKKLLIFAVTILIVGFGFWAESFAFKTYRDPNNAYSFSYPSDFTLSNGSFVLPSVRYFVSGIKVSRNLPVPNCSESGLPEHCLPFTENPSVNFFIVGASMDDLLDPVREELGPLLQPVKIAGQDGFSLELGVEGEGIFIYYIPLSNDMTLVIARNYIDENNLTFYKGQQGFLNYQEQERVFEQIISTLKLKQQ